MNAMTAYPGHNKKLVICIDISYYQLSAMIIQEGRPVAYLSKTLTSAQITALSNKNHCQLS